jgi:PKD repeat protein/photosystem II stability/assembly factor-like uncharacterized protein
MMKNNSAIALFMGLWCWISVDAQVVLPDSSSYPYWIEMMQNPKADFYATQRAFEAYWQHKTVTKGCGWKPFKRWENYMETRVDAQGNKPAAGSRWEEYLAYQGKRQKSFNAEGLGNWKELGPISMPSNGTGQPNGLGRVNCIAFHPVFSNTVYIGAPSGGFWRTFDGGVNWETTTDSLPTLGVSSIAINHENPDVILMGTGDRDGGDAPGIGVMMSRDGGDSWAQSSTGMGNRTVGRMIIHPTDTNVVLAATSGGIYKSSNGGANWSRRSTSSRHFKDIVFKPGDPTIAYATEGGDFYRSSNTGTTWSLITSGLASNKSRMVIGVTPADPNYVYLLAVDGSSFEGFYRSTNSGLNFTLQSDTPNIMDYSATGSGTGGQGWYDLCVAIDPTNANIVYTGGVNIFKSTDGGVSWNINAHWTGSGGAPDIHADQHELIFSPHNNDLYAGNDGGIYNTSNGGATWNDLSSGLAIAQIYKIGQSTLSSSLIINGYQDNGTSVYDGNWRTEIGGDGMECIVDYQDTNYLYGALYYGDVRRSANNGVNFSRIAADGKNGITESGAWITPYILDHSNSSTMFIGYRNLWRSTNIKTGSASAVSWSAISNNLAGSNSNTIRVIEQSPANSNILYFSRADDKLFRSDNIQSGAPSYVNLTANLPTAQWPVDIEAHPIDPDKVWIAQSNRIFQSINKGSSWVDISGSLPNVSINCIVYDESSNGDLYAGTDLGVYFRGASMLDWVAFNASLPVSVEVTELEIYYDADRTKSRIKAATYGRGLWESELYQEPVAEFTAEMLNACVDQPIQFTDESSGSYQTILWSFPGANPSTSLDRFPVVRYLAPGVYPVSLTISSSVDLDSIRKTAYITVGPRAIEVTPQDTTIQLGDSALLIASGGSMYFWGPPSGVTSVSSNSVMVKPIQTTTYYVHGGIGGPCDTSRATVNVPPLGIKGGDLQAGVHIYPNPASSKVTIDMGKTNITTFVISITDVNGKELRRQDVSLASGEQQYVIQLDGLAKGVLFVHMETTSDRQVWKLLHR